MSVLELAASDSLGPLSYSSQAFGANTNWRRNRMDKPW